jgi:hypothetical protein
MWQDLFIGGKDWEAYWLPQKSCHTFPHFFHHTIRHRAKKDLTNTLNMTIFFLNMIDNISLVGRSKKGKFMGRT